MLFDDPSYLPRGHSPPPSSSSSLLVEHRDLACQSSSLMHWITYLPSELGVCATFVVKVNCVSYEGGLGWVGITGSTDACGGQDGYGDENNRPS